jgi:hypothetical protein
MFRPTAKTPRCVRASYAVPAMEPLADHRSYGSELSGRVLGRWRR